MNKEVICIHEMPIDSRAMFKRDLGIDPPHKGDTYHVIACLSLCDGCDYYQLAEYPNEIRIGSDTVFVPVFHVLMFADVTGMQAIIDEALRLPEEKLLISTTRTGRPAWMDGFTI